MPTKPHICGSTALATYWERATITTRHDMGDMFTFEHIEQAVERWNTLKPRQWLAKDLGDNSDSDFEKCNPEDFVKRCLDNPKMLQELLEICPEVIETVPAVAQTLTLLFKQAAHHSRTNKYDPTPTRARKILASLIPRNRGGKKSIPTFITVQVWSQCHHTVRALRAELRAVKAELNDTGGKVDALLAAEPWLERFFRRHYNLAWRDALETLLGITEVVTPYNAGLEVAARILCVSPSTVRRTVRKLWKIDPPFWADLPIGACDPELRAAPRGPEPKRVDP